MTTSSGLSRILACAAATLMAAALVGFGPTGSVGAATAHEDAVVAAAHQDPVLATRAGRTRIFDMVSNVRRFGETYVGNFAIVRRQGRQFSGVIGAFYSEAFCFSGRLRGGKIRGTATSPETGTTRFRAKWFGTGARQHFARYSNVTPRRLTRLSGGFVTHAWASSCFN